LLLHSRKQLTPWPEERGVDHGLSAAVKLDVLGLWSANRIHLAASILWA
jgi:hypothetical protein